MNAILPFPPGNAAYTDWVENSMKLKLKINIVIKINAKYFQFKSPDLKFNELTYILPTNDERLKHLDGDNRFKGLKNDEKFN